MTAVALGTDGDTVISGGLDDTIRVWRCSTGELLNTLRGHTKAVNCLTVSPDGKTLVSGGDDATIRVWNLKTGALLMTLSGHARDVSTPLVRMAKLW